MKPAVKIFKIRVPYLIQYDFCFMGTAEPKQRRITAVEGTEIDLVNQVLKSHENEAGTVQNIRIKKLN